MAKKRKNSNYVTNKTVAKKEQALKDRRNAKVKKYSFITLLTVLISALIITGLVFIVLGINKHYDEEAYNAYKDALNSRYDKVSDKISTQKEKFEVTHKVTLEVKDLGNITIDLYGKEAPYAVANFIKLVETGYYDGIKFTGGSTDMYLSAGPSSSSTTLTEIPIEIKDNKVDFIRGTLSMIGGATGKVSATDFFFTLSDKTGLGYKENKAYTPFGMVTSGMDLIDKMAADLGFYYEYDGNKNLTWKPEDKPAAPVITKATVTESNLELEAPTVTHRAEVKLEGYDAFSIDLFGAAAPKTVELFVKLLTEKYYDGKRLSASALEDGFFVFNQADSSYSHGTVNGEFIANDWDNFTKIEQGVIILERASTTGFNTGSYKFKILFLDDSEENAEKLNKIIQTHYGYYSVFGKISEQGIATLKDIAAKYDTDYKAYQEASKQYDEDKANYDKLLEEYDNSTDPDKVKPIEPTKPTAPVLPKMETFAVKETLAENFKELTATHKVEIELEGYGTVKLDLYGNHAPISVQRFVELVESGYYNGKAIHRVVENFCFQGGKKDKDDTSALYTKTIIGEFYENGYYNPIKFTEGTIAFARATDPDSASCEFFIVPAITPKGETDKEKEDNKNKALDNIELSLDNKYAAFGQVTEGLDIITEIIEYLKTNKVIGDKDETIEGDNELKYQPIITSITVTAVK